MTNDGDPNELEAAYEAAIRLLARREHSVVELQRKLRGRSVGPDTVDAVVERLLDEGSLSDRRFTEVFVRQRCEQGYGPLRILADLGQRGVDEALARRALAAEEVDWHDRARAAYRKRFGATPPADRRDWGRRARFLGGRGFAAEQVRQVLDEYSDSTEYE